MQVALPGSPFMALPSADGCWLFVSLTQPHAGVAVLHRAEGEIALVRTVRLPGLPTGMALTHDGALLVVADGVNVAFLDVRRLTTGLGRAVLGYWGVGGFWPESIYVSVTADDHYLFVSNEAVGTISVVDLLQTRRSHFAQVRVVGSIAVGAGPIGLAYSADERILFATVQSVSDMGWAKRCRSESEPTVVADHPEGAIVVVDMKVATSNPGAAVLRRVPAGCNPVRIVASRERGSVYVTARGSNELLAFTERELSRSGPDPRPTRLAVGTSPVGVAIIDKGRKIVVAGSNRFYTAATAPALYVIDTGRMGGKSTPLLGTIPSGGFPREIRATADGRTLLVTDFDAHALQIVDLDRAPWDFALNNGRDSNRLSGPALGTGLISNSPPREQCCGPVRWLADAVAWDEAPRPPLQGLAPFL